MAIEDAPQIIMSILNEGDLVRIQEEFKIPMSIRLKLPGPSKRVTTRLTIWVALYKEALRARLRLPLLAVIAELLQWYQVCPT